MSLEKSSIVERWRDSHENSSIPDLGPVSSFWSSNLSLFKNLLRLAKTAEPFLPPSDLFPRLVSELQRFYLWGDGVSASQGHLDKVLDQSAELRHGTLFIMDQLSRTLSDDLYRLVNTKPHRDNALTAAMTEIHQMQKIADNFLSADEVDMDPELDCSSLPENLEMVSLDAEEVLEDIITYIDCLMDLCDALENPTHNALEEEDAVELGTEISLSGLPRSSLNDQVVDDDDDDGSMRPDSADLPPLQLQQINSGEVDTEEDDDTDGADSADASPSQPPHNNLGEVGTEEHNDRIDWGGEYDCCKCGEYGTIGFSSALTCVNLQCGHSRCSSCSMAPLDR
ncbi:hypothetical protein QBC43DRAFT_359334 [Cladorrhinum sp. PSN259]|nr:hypothetical protein QBC43DRAFT_359334 [Cladorrhinum sp. PSN259]